MRFVVAEDNTFSPLFGGICNLNCFWKGCELDSQWNCEHFPFFYFIDWTSKSWEKSIIESTFMEEDINHNRWTSCLGMIKIMNADIIEIKEQWNNDAVLSLMVVVNIKCDQRAVEPPRWKSEPPHWKCGLASEKGLPDPQKMKIWSQKKSLSPNPSEHGLFAKKRIKIGKIWPLQLHFWSTDAYMGSPPYAIFPIPDTKKYSIVLC